MISGLFDLFSFAVFNIINIGTELVGAAKVE